MLSKILDVIRGLLDWWKQYKAEKSGETVGDIVRRHNERLLRQKDRLDESKSRPTGQGTLPPSTKES